VRRQLTLRAVLVAVALLVVTWVFGDLLGASVAALALAATYAGLSPRRLPLVGVGALGCAAVSWLVGNASRWGEVSFQLVTENPWPERFALAALVVLLVGVVLDLEDVREDRGEERGRHERA